MNSLYVLVSREYDRLNNYFSTYVLKDSMGGGLSLARTDVL